MTSTGPKKADIVAQELQSILEKFGKNYITLSWDDMYLITNRKHWTDKAHDETRDELQELGLIIGYGDCAIIVAKDENFAPMEV